VANGPLQCLSESWEGERLFLHPPLNRITAVLERLHREPTPALLITPAWTSQSWCLILAEMVERQFLLGTFDEAMQTTALFRTASWRLPPGKVVATLLGTRTTRDAPSTTGF
jgi:hypothetical protein